MGHYSPAAGAHAVEQAVVGIRLFQLADQQAYQSAIDVAAALSDELPGRMQIDPMALAFGRQAITHGYVTQAQMEPGFLFQRVRPDGSTEHELTIERGAITYRTHAYQRWSDVVRILQEVLCPVAAALSGEDLSIVSVIELRCIDRFNQEGEGPTPLRALVRNDSKLIPAWLLDLTELAHCHCGWFHNQTDDGRYLLNFNLDLAEIVAGQRSATLLQVISKQAVPGKGFFSSSLPFNDAIIEVFSELHSLDKSLLAGIITEEMQDRIGLTGISGIQPL